METKKETVEVGSEATKSDFIQRADEMSDVLMDMAKQKAASRAVVMVAIEDDDKGNTDSIGALGGNGRQLLRMFRSMWRHEKIGPFMKMVAVVELGKVALDDGRE